MAGTERNGEKRSGEALNGRRLAELRQIERDGNGVVHPEAVVEFARDPETALHSAFEWDDSKAAEQYRIEQARRLLRVLVEVVPHKSEPIRAFVALKSERYEDGGYRYMPTLLAKKAGREAVLETALWELEAFSQKYKELTELAEVFAAVRRIKGRVAA